MSMETNQKETFGQVLWNRGVVGAVGDAIKIPDQILSEKSPAYKRFNDKFKEIRIAKKTTQVFEALVLAGCAAMSTPVVNHPENDPSHTQTVLPTENPQAAIPKAEFLAPDDAKLIAEKFGINEDMVEGAYFGDATLIHIKNTDDYYLNRGKIINPEALDFGTDLKGNSYFGPKSNVENQELLENFIWNPEITDSEGNLAILYLSDGTANTAQKFLLPQDNPITTNMKVEAIMALPTPALPTLTPVPPTETATTAPTVSKESAVYNPDVVFDPNRVKETCPMIKSLPEYYRWVRQEILKNPAIYYTAFGHDTKVNPFILTKDNQVPFLDNGIFLFQPWFGTANPKLDDPNLPYRHVSKFIACWNGERIYNPNNPGDPQDPDHPPVYMIFPDLWFNPNNPKKPSLLFSTTVLDWGKIPEMTYDNKYLADAITRWLKHPPNYYAAPKGFGLALNPFDPDLSDEAQDFCLTGDAQELVNEKEGGIILATSILSK